MNNTNNPLPSQDDFMANHLHASIPPNEEGARCSICFVEWTEDGQDVVRIDINHTTPCFYHRECIVTWFQAIGQNHWTCPEHRIELFQPVEEEEWTPQVVVTNINGHPFIHDSPEDLYEYAEIVLRRLEQRIMEGILHRDTNMSRHGYQRVHDLQLAAAMRNRQNQNAQFYEWADSITRMTEEYDREFIDYMRERIGDILSLVIELQDLIPTLEDRVPDFYDLVAQEIDHRTSYLPDLTVVHSAIISDFFHQAMDLWQYTSFFARTSYQPTQEDVDREIRLRGLVMELDDNVQPRFAGYTAGERIRADENSYTYSVSEFYDLALESVEYHENLAADSPEQMAGFLSEWGWLRRQQLRCATVLSGHQHLDPEFRIMAQLLRDHVQDADALFRARAPALIEEAAKSDEDIGLDAFRRADLRNRWFDVPDVSVESFISLTQMCVEALKIQEHIRYYVSRRERESARGTDS